MPLYEYYCHKCASKFEMLRTMGRSDEPGTCPKGHSGGARTITTFAAVSKGDGAGMMDAPSGGGGCGCGGGGCGCGR